MAFAHALIELEDGTRIQRGETVPDDVPGLDELREAGSVSDEEYDPEQDVTGPPETVEIQGVRYVQVRDDSEAGDVRS